MKTVNEYGSVEICNSAFEDIANIAASKIKGIYPNKRNSGIAECTMKDDELIINLNIKAKTGIDISKVSSRLQSRVHELVEEMTGIDCKKINVNIVGFVK